MKKILPFLSLFIFLVSVSLFYFFRQTPKGELWNGYSILYVSGDTSDEDVITVLNTFGINDFCCLSNQFMPTTLGADTPEISLMQFNSSSLDYLTKRTNYFFDKSHEYNLYYIPISEKAKLVSCVNYLSKNKIFSGVDSSTSYPILLPIIVFAFVLILFLFAKNKFLFLSSSVLAVLFAVSFPYLSCAVSAIILLLLLFVLSNLYKRRGAINIVAKKIIFNVLLIVSIASAFTATIISGVMFIVLIFGSASAYYLFDFITQYRYESSSFKPLLIRSAKFVPQFAGKEKIIFPVSIILVIAVFAVSIFSIDSFSIGESSIALPSANATVHSDNLPDLNEYAKWDYIVRTYPYRSINTENDLLSPVSFYKYDSEGKMILESAETISYNNEFIDGSINQIDNLGFNSIEKIIKEQESAFLSGYSVSGSHRLSFFSIILVLAQFLCLSFFYIKTVFKKNWGSK